MLYYRNTYSTPAGAGHFFEFVFEPAGLALCLASSNDATSAVGRGASNLQQALALLTQKCTEGNNRFQPEEESF